MKYLFFLVTLCMTAQAEVTIWEEYDLANNQVRTGLTLDAESQKLLLSRGAIDRFPASKAGDCITVTRNGLPVLIYLGKNFQTGKLGLFSTMLKEGGRWSDPELLSHHDEEIAHIVQVVVSGRGQVTAVWGSYLQGSHFLTTRAATIANGENWSYPVTLPQQK